MSRRREEMQIQQEMARIRKEMEDERRKERDLRDQYVNIVFDAL